MTHEYVDINWDGPRRQQCPQCGRGPKDRTLGVTHDWRGCVAHCFRCDYVGTRTDDEVSCRPVKPPPQAPAAHEVLSDYWQTVWRNCSPVSGVARAYLDARDVAIPPDDGDLRWHPSLKHPTGYVGPALVALITDAITRESISLHRTWICPDGTKAAVDPPRLLLAHHRKAGGVIRLWPDDMVTYGLGIAEGIETALAMARHYTPMWSAIDVGNLRALPVLAGIQTLIVGADNDPAGLKGATACADRWTDAGVEVYLLESEIPGTDWATPSGEIS